MSSLTSFTGNVPLNYDQYLGPVLFEIYAADLAQRLKKESLHHVLEIACGTGRLTHHIASVLPPDGKLIATDLNADMLEQAKKKVKSKQVEWKVVDAQDLPFPDDSFDIVVCQFGVMFFPDKLKAFREARRVLKENGKYIFYTWDSMDFNPRTSILRDVMDDVFGKDAPDFFKKGPHSFFDHDEIRRLLSDAGFRDIEIETVAKTGQLDTEAGFLKGFVEGSPLGSYLADRDVAVHNSIREKLKEALEAQSAEYGKSVPMQAILCQGKK